MIRISRSFDGLKPYPSINPQDYRLKNFIDKRAKLTLDEIIPKDWNFPQASLDQLDTEHCGGFGMADWGICEPTNTKYTEADAHNFYYLCKEKEGEPLKENGIYVRTAAAVLLDLHKLEAYAFTSSIEEIVWWISNKGSVMIGTAWYSGMSNPDSNNIMHATGTFEGGHFWLAKGITSNRLVNCQNSWGEEWGVNGKALISLDDLQKILGVYGEAITAVELEDAIVPPPEPEPPIIEPDPPIIVDPVEPEPPFEPPIPPETNKGCLAALMSLLKKDPYDSI